jgi:hypothetical protein
VRKRAAGEFRFGITAVGGQPEFFVPEIPGTGL